jgi:hypothetical protein
LNPRSFPFLENKVEVNQRFQLYCSKRAHMRKKALVFPEGNMLFYTKSPFPVPSPSTFGNIYVRKALCATPDSRNESHTTSMWSAFCGALLTCFKF